MSSFPGYFDFNATTPMSEAAAKIWSATAFDHWQNPSGLYREAGEARQLLEFWREKLADHFTIDEPERVVFTSGATEANNAVIRYFSESLPEGGAVGVSAIEHPSVEAAVEAFFPEEKIRRVPVSRETGVIDLEILKTWILSGELGAVSVMAANNETGACQPWHDVSRFCREAEIPFHTDAAQWIGKLPVEGIGECGFVTGSGHKFQGGKGVGFLILPPGRSAAGFHGFIGGPQEEGRRAGTENLPGVAALVTALLEREDKELSVIASTQSQHRDAFENRIAQETGCRILATKGPRLWNTSMFVLPHSKNLKWLSRLSQRGIAVSTGSACSAGKGNPSSVMMAMGLDYEEMGRVLRVSGGWETEASDWESLAGALAAVAAELEAD